MKLISSYIPFFLIIALLVNISCEDISGDDIDLEETLELIEEVELISGGENVTITVKLNNKEAYFDVELSDIEPNDIIQNGSKKAWCIDIWQDIDHEGGTYADITLYSTYRVEKWKPINYMFNIMDELLEDNPELTWLEFQVAIWSLRENPEFSLDEVNIEELPEQFHSNGEPKFSSKKVNELLDIIKTGYKEFDYENSDRFVVVVETPADIQTVIITVEK